MSSDTRRLVAIIDAQTRIGAAGLDSAAILGVAAAEARGMTGAHASTIEVVDPDGIVELAAADNATVRAGRPLDPERLAARPLTTREPVSYEDTERVRHGALERASGIRSLIAVPIMGPDYATGVITVTAEEPGAFAEDDVATLTQLSRFVGHQLEQARRFEDAHRTSRRDALTGLGNRRSLDETLVRELDRLKRYGGVLSVCVIDLDGFKAVNDTAGHHAGDKVLIRVGMRLSEIRGADYAFRLGGDEFALVLPETAHARAELVARRVAYLISEDTEIFGVTASWGVVEADDSSEPVTLLADADARLYARKHESRGEQASA